MSTTSSQRFFFNSDLVIQLVDYRMRHSDRLAIALLCRACSDVALDRLWRHVNRSLLSNLVNILAPLELENAYSSPPLLKFKRMPLPEDWARFIFYARRIRTLRFVYNPFGRTRSLLSLQTFEQLRHMNTGGPLLPNLSHLEWNTSKAFMYFCPMFLHPGLREIRIGYNTFRGLGFPDPSDILHEIASRAPDVQRLSIKALFGPRHLVDEILQILPKLPGLICLDLPRLWITSDAISQFKAASVQKEKMKVLPYLSPQDCVNDANSAESLFRQLHINYISDLRELCITASLEDVFYLVDSPNLPPHLTWLTILSPILEPSTTVHDFLALCARHLPMLVTLNLNLVPLKLKPDYRDSVLVHGAYSTTITAQTLSPLLDFPNIRYFMISSYFPVDISEEELVNLIRDWTGLRSLELTSHPVIEAFRSKLTLKTLIHFMRYCPDLIYLSLWVDATELTDLKRYKPLTPLSPVLRFIPSFLILGLGTSMINEDGVAIITAFLTHYFPLYQGELATDQAENLIDNYRPTLEVWHRYWGSFGVTQEHRNRLNLWESIALRLPALVLERDMNDSE